MSDEVVLALLNRKPDVDSFLSFTSSAQAIVPCEEGQAVQVAMVSNYRLYDDDAHYNHFSGVLVKEGLDYTVSSCQYIEQYVW